MQPAPSGCWWPPTSTAPSHRSSPIHPTPARFPLGRGPRCARGTAGYHRGADLRARAEGSRRVVRRGRRRGSGRQPRIGVQRRLPGRRRRIGEVTARRHRAGDGRRGRAVPRGRRGDQTGQRRLPRAKRRPAGCPTGPRRRTGRGGRLGCAHHRGQGGTRVRRHRHRQGSGPGCIARPDRGHRDGLLRRRCHRREGLHPTGWQDVGVKVGSGDTRAAYRVDTPEDIAAALWFLHDVRGGRAGS